MGKINWARVVLGGLVVMIVNGVVAAIQIPMFSGAFETAFDALGGALPQCRCRIGLSEALLTS